MSVNKVILIGNVGKDPEVRYLEGGVVVAKFPFATSESYKNKNGERINQTEWHNVVLWRGQAEFAEKFISKGVQLYIEGRIKSRSWDDKEGNKRYITEIYGDNLRLLTKKSEPSTMDTEESRINNTEDKAKPNSEDDEIFDDDEKDDLPF